MPESEETLPAPSGGVGPLDIDFLVFAVPTAFVLDLLSWGLMGLDAGLLAAGANIFLGGLLFLWMVKRGAQIDKAKEHYETGVRTARMGRKGLEQRGAAAQKMAGRTGKRASKRLFRRALIMFIGESIPVVNFIPFWLVGVLLMLREK